MNAPSPCEAWRHWYEKPQFSACNDPVGRPREIALICRDFGLAKDTPEEIIKDILLDNGFFEYAELLFPETKYDSAS